MHATHDQAPQGDDESQREGKFQLYFTWAFALQEKGKREYLHMYVAAGNGRAWTHVLYVGCTP
jgi:hypothetical protein